MTNTDVILILLMLLFLGVYLPLDAAAQDRAAGRPKKVRR